MFWWTVWEAEKIYGVWNIELSVPGLFSSGHFYTCHYREPWVPI